MLRSSIPFPIRTPTIAGRIIKIDAHEESTKFIRRRACELAILHARGYSAPFHRFGFGRSPNTIAAELKRNSYQVGKSAAWSSRLAPL